MREAHAAWIFTNSGERRTDIRVPATVRNEHNDAFREHPRRLARVKPQLADAATPRQTESHLTAMMYARRAAPLRHLPERTKPRLSVLGRPNERWRCTGACGGERAFRRR